MVSVSVLIARPAALGEAGAKVQSLKDNASLTGR